MPLTKGDLTQIRKMIKEELIEERITKIYKKNRKNASIVVPDYRMELATHADMLNDHEARIADLEREEN